MIVIRFSGGSLPVKSPYAEPKALATLLIFEYDLKINFCETVMHALISGLKTETNTFAARPTRREDFDVLDTGDFLKKAAAGSLEHHQNLNGYMTFCRLAVAHELDVRLGPAACATPGGPVEHNVYETFKASILEAVRAGPAPDLILLDLHGAMMTPECEDCEGDLLEAIASVAPRETVIAALLDPHASLTMKMLQNTNLLHAYKEYPHTDVAARAEELFQLALATAEKKISPSAAISEANVLGGFPTTQEPMKTFVQTLKAVEERPEILATSLIHGFPWSDSRENGARMLVYSDGDPERSAELAPMLAGEFRSIAQDAANNPFSIEDALAALKKRKGDRFILADASDNPGGGADGDATHALRRLIDKQIFPLGAAVIADAQSLETCLEAGVGQKVALKIGGKAAATSGEPVELIGLVAAIAPSIRVEWSEGAFTVDGPFVRFEFNGGDIILTARRLEARWPELFTELGADPAQYRAILVKSSNHFRAGFSRVPAEIIAVGSPTAMNPDLTALPFQRLTRPVWPLRPWDEAAPQGEAILVETRSNA